MGVGKFYERYIEWGNDLMMKNIMICAAISTALMSSSAFASDAEEMASKDMAAGIKCIPAKKIIKMVRKFEKLKPEKRDTVSAVPSMKLSAEDSTNLPTRVYFRKGTLEDDFTIDKDGWVTDFARIGSMDKKGEICMQGKQFVKAEDEKTGIELAIDIDILFKNTSGMHTLAELKDGTKDGKSHYKKMFPGPMAIMVPKMTHVGVVYLADDDAPINKAPQISATKGGAKLAGLLVENFDGMFVVGIEDLQNLGADGLQITGEKYELTPIPSIQKMKDLGFAEDEEEGED